LAFGQNECHERDGNAGIAGAAETEGGQEKELDFGWIGHSPSGVTGFLG
jgi:hypothetical protein